MNVCQYKNCEILKFMEDFSSNYDILLPILNTFTFDNDEFCLDVNYKVNDASVQKNLYHHCSFI